MKTTIATLCLLAGVASADQVNLTYNGHAGNLGRDLTVQLSGGLFFQNGASSSNVWAGLHSIDVDGQDILSWCTELTQWAGSGIFDVVTVNNAPNPGTPMGQEKADAIYRLFNATDRGGDIATNAEASAFQAVIWEIVYEYTGDESGINHTAGRVQFDSGINATLFAQYASLAADAQGDDTPSMIAYVNDTRQDMLGPQVVPLPGAAAMAGLGLAGIAARRRRG